MNNSISPSVKLGEHTIVWNYAVILDGVIIGDDCSIGSHVEIGHGCKIGNRCRIGKGVFLPPNSVVGDNVFIGPGTIFCDDRHPLAGNKAYTAEPPVIEDWASVGAGVVVLPGVRIGNASLIGAGSVITRNVESGTMVRGEPSRIQSRL